MEGSSLLRAGSWGAQAQDPGLLKTASDVFFQMAALQQHPKVSRLAEDGKTNSIDSSSTAAGARGGAAHLLDTGTLLPPLRQISLDIIQATALQRAKSGVHRQGSERQNIFHDVFNELAGKDEAAPLQAGQLYTLPSMQFLESMLSDFDARGGAAPGAGPLDLPADAFDLPDAWAQQGAAPGLRPTPFDQQVHMQQQQQQRLEQQQFLIQARVAAGYGGGVGPVAAHRDSTSTAYTGFVPMGSAASAPVALAPAPATSSMSGSMSLAPSARAHSAYPAHMMVAASAAEACLQQQQLLAMQQVQQQQQQQLIAAAGAGVRGPAAPQPAQPRATPRRQSHAYADFEYEEPEVSIQTSKSGRVRKVASFTGVKRRLDVAASESRDSHGSVGDATSGEVGSKGSKGARKGATGPRGRKGRRTVCLNCGAVQTPQWRCGPLGPRTLCNACGVRYKKDLPLNCWPIRDGMVLPPGAQLPPGFVCPPGITIHTQPADFDL